MTTLNKGTLVTVLMPVYNGARYMRESIDSILTQTFPDFVFLIINDGSTDETEKIIFSYSDGRIRYIKNEINIGLVATLNKGLDLIETEYLVRMDADDIAVPKRLEWQVGFMNKNTDIGLSGGLFEVFGNESGFPLIPLDNDTIKANLLFDNVICHPSVIIRNEVLKKNRIYFGVPFSYDDNYGHKILELEDYALWHKLKLLAPFANLDKILIKYRREGQNLTAHRLDLILERKKKFYTYLLEELDIQPTGTNLLKHISFTHISATEFPTEIGCFKEHLDLILFNNFKKNIYPQLALEKVVLKKWEGVFYHLPQLGIKYVIAYWKCDKKIRYSHFVYFLKYRINALIKRASH